MSQFLFYKHDGLWIDGCSGLLFLNSALIFKYDTFTLTGALSHSVYDTYWPKGSAFPLTIICLCRATKLISTTLNLYSPYSLLIVAMDTVDATFRSPMPL